jgi:hypothetical protein
MAVGYSSSSQEATVLWDSQQTNSRQTDQQTEQRLPNISSPPAADSSPPRQIAAATPPKIVTAPSNRFNNNKPGNNIFISPPVARAKWDPIKNGKLQATPVDDKDFTHLIPGGLNKLLERQGEQNERRMHNILSSSANKQKLCRPYVSVPMGLPSTELERLGRMVQEARSRLALGKEDHRRQRDANGHHLVTTASNEDDKMTCYANKDGKQLYRVPQRQMKSDETTPGRTSTLPSASATTPRQQQRPHPHLPRLQTGTSKSGLASPDLLRQFNNNFILHLLIQLSHACIYFCV